MTSMYLSASLDWFKMALCSKSVHQFIFRIKNSIRCFKLGITLETRGKAE